MPDQKTSDQFIHASGEMSDLIRSFNWSKTPLGDLKKWPELLLITVNLLLDSRFPMFLWWGPDKIQLYNDAYRAILGTCSSGKHPQALGQEAETSWKEIWSTISPLMDKVFETGEAVYLEDQLIPIFRDGHLDEVFWTFSYSPVRGEGGNIAGILVVCKETTSQVEALRRQLTLRNTSFPQQGLKTQSNISASFLNELGKNPYDIPFAIIFLADNFGKLKYAGSKGIPFSKEIIQLFLDDTRVQQAYHKKSPLVMNQLISSIAAIPCPFWHDPVEEAYVLPLFHSDHHEVLGVLTMGISPRKNQNSDYLSFMELVAASLSAQLNQLSEINKQFISKRAAQISEERLQHVIGQAPVAIAIFRGPDFKIELANQKMLEYWGRDEHQVINQPLFKVLPESGGHEFEALLIRSLKEGAQEADEIPLNLIRNEKLEQTWINFISELLIDLNGQTTGMMVVCSEITEQVKSRKQLESINQELQESEQRFRTMVEKAPVAIAIFKERQLIIESANDMILGFWGKGADIINQPLALALPELKGQIFLQLLDDVYTSGSPYYGYEQKATLIHDGKPKDFYFNFVYQQIELKSDVTRIMAVATDVTELVRARKALEDAYEQLSLSKKAAELGTFDMDLIKGTMVWDDRCRMLFGISHSNPVHYEHDFLRRLHEDDRERVANLIKKLFNQHNDGDYDVEYRTIGLEDKKTRWVRAKGKVFFSQQGKPIRFIGSVLEITKQKEEEQRKNDFIGMVSHELKTPLTLLKANVQLLQLKAKKKEDNATVATLEKVEQQVNKMNTMINGFLDTAYLESQDLQLRKEDFHLNELLYSVTEETRHLDHKHQILLKNCERVLVHADREKIGYVIANLLGNAIKYSPKGETIDVQCKAFADEVLVSIRDEGIGIDKQDIARIFERYYRVESNQTHHISGFGIGLYMSSEIIKEHKGKIWAKSERGQGTTFFFSLPLN